MSHKFSTSFEIINAKGSLKSYSWGLVLLKMGKQRRIFNLCFTQGTLDAKTYFTYSFSTLPSDAPTQLLVSSAGMRLAHINNSE